MLQTTVVKSAFLKDIIIVYVLNYQFSQKFKLLRSCKFNHNSNSLIMSGINSSK